jgi:hypothetical protein
MEKPKALDEIIEGEMSLLKKVEEAFRRASDEKPPQNTLKEFQVTVVKKNRKETEIAVVYSVQDGITTDKHADRLFYNDFWNDDGVYASTGLYRSKDGYYSSCEYFSRKVGRSYHDVVLVDSGRQLVTFDRKSVEEMSDFQLRKFAKAVNRYLLEKISG